MPHPIILGITGANGVQNRLVQPPDHGLLVRRGFGQRHQAAQFGQRRHFARRAAQVAQIAGGDDGVLDVLRAARTAAAAFQVARAYSGSSL